MPFLAPDGTNLADDFTVQGIPWLAWIGFEARVNTYPGAQLRRPAYGLDLSQFIDHAFTPVQIRQIVNNGFADLPYQGAVSITYSGQTLTIQSLYSREQ